MINMHAPTTIALALLINVTAIVIPRAEELPLQGKNRIVPAQVRFTPSKKIKPSPTPNGNPIAQISLSSLSVTRERPIFSPSRRPPPIKISLPHLPTKIEQQNQPQLVLLGAIAAGHRGMAIFKDEKNQSVIRMRVGESHFGWILQRVNGRQATMKNGNLTTVLAIPNPPPN